MSDTITILITSRSFGVSDPGALELLTERGCRLVYSPYERPLTPDELRPLLADVDGVIAGVDRFDRSVLEAAPRLRAISRYGVGVDTIDLEAAAERGIIVRCLPGINADAVAELTWGLIFAVARRIAEADRRVREGGWPRIVGMGLAGKTLGLLGLGHVGKAVARRAAGFAMHLLAHDSAPDESFADSLGIELVGLDELLARSDILSLHVPLTPDTEGIIGEAALSKMRSGAILINTARGALVDEQALHEALRSGQLAGAGLDVFAAEPPAGSPLLDLDNLVCTPHMASYTKEVLCEMDRRAAENLVAALETSPSESTKAWKKSSTNKRTRDASSGSCLRGMRTRSAST